MTARAPHGLPPIPAPLKRSDPTSELCRAVREEVRRCAMFPDGWDLQRSSLVDLDAEREVLAAMTCDQPPPPWLKPEHFFQLFHAAVFVLWAHWLNDGRLFASSFEERIADTIAAIKRNRIGGPLVERAVFQVAYEWPCVLPVEHASSRVVRAWAMRNARSECRRLEALLSLDARLDEELTVVHQAMGDALARAREAVGHGR